VLQWTSLELELFWTHLYVSFICPRPFSYYLGEEAVKNNNSSFIVNAKVPCAAAMSGIRQTSIAGFLALLGVASFGPQYNKGFVADILLCFSLVRSFSRSFSRGYTQSFRERDGREIV